MNRLLRLSHLAFLLPSLACSVPPAERTGGGAAALNDGQYSFPAIFREGAWIFSEQSFPQVGAAGPETFPRFTFGNFSDFPILGDWNGAKNQGQPFTTVGVYRIPGGSGNSCAQNRLRHARVRLGAAQHEHGGGARPGAEQLRGLAVRR